MLIAPTELPGPIVPPEPESVPLMFRLPPSTAPEFTAASPVIVTGVLVVPPCVLAPPLKSTEPVIVVGAVRLKLKLVLEAPVIALPPPRSEEHTSELQSLMRISYAVFCLKKKKQHTT